MGFIPTWLTFLIRLKLYEIKFRVIGDIKIHGNYIILAKRVALVLRIMLY